MRTPKFATWEEDFQYHESFEDTQEMEAILDYKLDPALDYAAAKIKPLDDVQPYLKSLYDYPVLTRHGERMLFLQMNYAKFRACQCEDGSRERNDFLKIAYAARDILITHNLRLVVHLVKQRPYLEQEEAICDGNVYLMRAVDKFDVNRLNDFGGTNKFSTYASWSITNNFYRRGKPGLPMSDAALEDCYPIDDNPENLDDKMDIEEIISRMMRRLDRRTRAVIRRRFGIGCNEETLASIGNSFHLSKERVRQIQHAGFLALRSPYEPRKKKTGQSAAKAAVPAKNSKGKAKEPTQKGRPKKTVASYRNH